VIKSVVATAYSGERLELVLNDPWEDGIAVFEISGIGPAKATIHTSSVASIDGDAYSGSRVGGRNITLTLGLLDLPDVEKARHKLYRIFQPRQQVNLEFHTDYRNLHINGWVESVEPNIFSQSEEIKVSVICPDPYFYGLDDERAQIFPFRIEDPNMEFEFQDPVNVSPSLELSKRKDEYETLIDYLGDAEAGVTITVVATGIVRNFAIWNRITNKKFSVDTDDFDKVGQPTELREGDSVVITTHQGNKRVHLYKKGSTTPINIIQCIPLNNDWLTLWPGRNIMFFQADVGKDAMEVSVEVQVRYSGV